MHITILSEKAHHISLGSYIRLWILYICQPNAFQGIETMERFHTNPADIYLLKFNNRNTRTRCEICSKLTINTPKRRQPFLDPLKTLENHKVFWCFQEEGKVQGAPKLCEGEILFDVPAWRGGKGQKKILRRRKKGGDIFFHYFGGESWNFYDPKIKICKINYCENKVKLNNNDNSKNNVNKIKQVIYSKYIIFIFTKV